MIRGAFSTGRRTLQTVVFRDPAAADDYLRQNPDHSIVGQVGEASRGNLAIHVARVANEHRPVRMSTEVPKVLVTQSNGILQGVTFLGTQMLRRPVDNEEELLVWAKAVHGDNYIIDRSSVVQMSTLRRADEGADVFVDDFGVVWRDGKTGEDLSGERLAEAGVRIAEENHNGFTFRTAYMSTKKGDWVVYKGPRGGKGWRHSSTGEVRYQKDKPDGADASTKPAGYYGPKEAAAARKPSQYKDGDRVSYADPTPSATGIKSTKSGVIIGSPKSTEPYYDHRVRFDDGTEDDYGHDELVKVDQPSVRPGAEMVDIQIGDGFEDDYDDRINLDDDQVSVAPVTAPNSFETGNRYKLPSNLRAVIGTMPGGKEPVLYPDVKMLNAPPEKLKRIEAAINEAIRYRDLRAEDGESIDYYVFFNGEEAWSASLNMYRELYRDRKPVAWIPAETMRRDTIFPSVQKLPPDSLSGGGAATEPPPAAAPAPTKPLSGAEWAPADSPRGRASATGVKGYYPEMGEKKPAAPIEARLSHYGKHYYLYTDLDLSGVGVTRLEDEQGYPAGHPRNGKKRYKVTTRAFDQIAKQHAVSMEMLL